MPPTSTFRKSFAVGSVGERRVCDILGAAGLSCRPNPERSDRTKMAAWDLEATIAGRQPFTLEVKFDAMATKTGNLAIEYYNPRLGKPSGILATSSDLWVIVLVDRVYVASTRALRRHFDVARPVRDVACGGDDNASMKLYRRDELIAAVPFFRLDDLPPWEVVPLLCSLLGPTHGPDCAAHRLEHAAEVLP